jgi:hypothetical protein
VAAGRGLAHEKLGGWRRDGGRGESAVRLRRRAGGSR